MFVSAGVFGDEAKSVSVNEGESVTLHTNLTELQKTDKIRWRFGVEGSIVKMYRGEITYDKFVDGRFIDRLQILERTGDLTIKNIRHKHAGRYEAEINHATGTTYKRLNVTVRGEQKYLRCCVVLKLTSSQD